MNPQLNLVEAVFETVPTAVLILQSLYDDQQVIIDFDVLTANEIAYQMAGRPVTGCRMLEIWPRTKEIGLFEQFVNTVMTSYPLTFTDHYEGEGAEAWYCWRATRLNDGLCVTIENITERQVAQARNQQTVQNLQRVLDSSPATIGLLKALSEPTNSETIIDFHLIVGNQKLAQFFGEPLSSLLGKSANRFGDMLWGEQTLEQLRLIYHTHQPYYEEKTVGKSWMALSIQRDNHGLVITGLDITQLKQIQAQEQQWLRDLTLAQQSADAINKLRESLSHRSELMRTLSHDLRANLGIMRGGLHLLDNAVSQTDRSELMEMVVRNVGQASDLLTNLLSFIESETGQQQRTITQVEVDQLMKELAQSLQAVAHQKQLWLEVNGPVNLVVESDSLLLYRLAQNMAVNALKYCQTGGLTIEWGHGPDPSQWWLKMNDTGPGLPSALIARLKGTEPNEAEAPILPSATLPNQRTELATQWIPLQSEGLGLRIVRQLTALLDGQLEVYSESGVGTQFVLRFPVTYKG